MATILDIADAVASDLNAGSFSLPFTAIRTYVPRFDLPEMADLRVTVVPKGLEIAAASCPGRCDSMQAVTRGTLLPVS